MKKIFLFLLLINSGLIPAQNLKIYGDPKPGSIVIGSGQGIKEVFLDDTKLLVDPSGIFVIGFDRDAAGKHILKAVLNSGTIETKIFDLPERKYVVQKFNIADKYVTPPKKELKRIEKETQLMRNARAAIGIIDTAFFASGFVMPVNGGRMSGVFGSQRVLNGTPKSPHNGIDLAAPKGTPVFAAAGGIVRIAGNNFYYNGNFVLLDHGQGLSSVFLHMSKLFVKDGDFVKKGQKIGEVGSTGRSTAPHLHWGVQWYNKRIDPESLFNIDMASK